MTVIQALMKEDLRISNGSKWLYFDQSTEEWVVLNRGYKKKQNDCLIRTYIQDEAIKVLLK